jgi:hypothetical protein
MATQKTPVNFAAMNDDQIARTNAVALHILAGCALSALHLMTVPPHKRDHYTVNPDGTLTGPDQPTKGTTP